MCGADEFLQGKYPAVTGSPPRVRSRLRDCQSVRQPVGITSACAEQTRPSGPVDSGRGDHLRVCGADSLYSSASSELVGSPPRVRSRRRSHARPVVGRGITSACAEQTPDTTGQGRHPKDHLRVCGADQVPLRRDASAGGSPPRVRSRPRVGRPGERSTGITSACAEQTTHGQGSGSDSGDHLRVCGADERCPVDHVGGVGSPPRVRSRHSHIPRPDKKVRITSACAEQTGASATR